VRRVPDRTRASQPDPLLRTPSRWLFTSTSGRSAVTDRSQDATRRMRTAQEPHHAEGQITREGWSDDRELTVRRWRPITGTRLARMTRCDISSKAILSTPGTRWSRHRRAVRTVHRHSLAKECAPAVDATTPSRGYGRRGLSDVHSSGTQCRRAPVAHATTARQHATLAVPRAAIALRKTAVAGCLRSVALVATLAVRPSPCRQTVSSWIPKLGTTLGVVRTTPRQQRFVRALSEALGAVRFHVADSHGERLHGRRIHHWSSGRGHWLWRRERGA
jgi:hypothetical protein